MQHDTGKVRKCCKKGQDNDGSSIGKGIFSVGASGFYAFFSFGLDAYFIPIFTCRA